MAVHPNSLANLKRGKKFGAGQPTHLGGAPRGMRLATLLREIARKRIDEEGLLNDYKGIPVTNALVMSILSQALQGDVKAAAIILTLGARSEK